MIEDVFFQKMDAIRNKISEAMRTYQENPSRQKGNESRPIASAIIMDLTKMRATLGPGSLQLKYDYIEEYLANANRLRNLTLGVFA
ncbi:MAG: hypothetical protein KJ600_06880 [Nanoarchaeota archaeon]|nr:hypothetical protein [Nanoarchaeota archaeon]MBU1104248.1 hypothetical protein [Nanoarchaeota archaeon]